MKKNLLSITALLVLSGSLFAQTNTGYLSETLFKNPPQRSKPRTWMHVMSGNMSKEGLTKDLEAISNVGIGGVLLFNIANIIPYGNVKYNSTEHRALLKHAAVECERLGLSFGFHNCAGWTSSGGPWIKPEESMKMLTYRQVVVNGGQNIKFKLPQPTIREGFYKDVAIIAYPALKSDLEEYNNRPKITSSYKDLNISIINDGRFDTESRLNTSGANDAYIIYDYGKPIKINSINISTVELNNKIEIQYSNDGINYSEKTGIPSYKLSKKENFYFCNLEKPVSARYYKLTFSGSTSIREIQLSPNVLVTDYINKNCIGRKTKDKFNRDQIVPKENIINYEGIIDITKDLQNDTLKTNLPKGQWTIMRIGYTSTGVYNHPASESGRGLECDKFSKSAVEKHFNSFAKIVIEDLKKVAPKAMQYVEIDSYEMGGQNWTEGFDEIFKRDKGYSIRNFLPVVFGKYVNNIATTEAVLSDFRDVCYKLMTDNYFKYFGELCNKNGVDYYLEPYGNGPFKELEAGSKCDIPMGEFWMNRDVNVQIPVSSAHIYGKNIISAESFTSRQEVNWKGHPAMAKPTGDKAWQAGINEFMFHRYAHQANTHVRPGMTMGFWGFHFDRTQTWWYNGGKEWFKYMARGSYMLRLGVPVNDILVFTGDELPAPIPRTIENNGLKFDTGNSDVLINRIKVKNKKMTLPEGTEYKILMLKNYDKTNLNSIKRICEIAEAGVPIIGDLPTSLLGYKNVENNNNKELNKLIERIKRTGNYYDEGKLKELMKEQGIEKDLIIKNSENLKTGFAHRHLDDGSEIYFISNPDSSTQVFECDFRVTGKKPELWNAMDGTVKDANNYIIHNGRTKVNVKLNGLESIFIVFKAPAKTKKINIEYDIKRIEEKSLNTDWCVKFLDEYGYNATKEFKTLTDWSNSKNDSIKYYSGTAIYRKEFNIEKEVLQKSNEAVLELGKVYIIAEIIINGKYVNTKWMIPYSENIYNYLKPGKNTIEIKITNQWTNRLIGDERYPKQDGGYKWSSYIPAPDSKMVEWYRNNEPMPSGPRTTFCTYSFYKKGDALLNAGLVGPVQINFYNKKEIRK